MPSVVEAIGRKRYDDGAGGYYEVVVHPRRSDVFRVSAEGVSASVGRLDGHPDISRARAALLVKAILQAEGKKLRRAERAKRVDPTTGEPVPRSPRRKRRVEGADRG